MRRVFPGIILTGGALAAAILLLTLLPLSTAAITQPQMFFRPMDLPNLQCPPNTAQRFDQDVDDVSTPTTRFLDRTTAGTTYQGALMVPAVFAGRQAWLILRITNLEPAGSGSTELHELFLTNGRGEMIFLGVINEALITPIQDVVFQIPQDFLTAGEIEIELQLDEGTPNQDPNVATTADGDITIDSMRVCYGGYFVYQIPLTCGFTPVDLKATEAPNQNPLTSVPAIKQGDYATNIIITNLDTSTPQTQTMQFFVRIEFALEVNPLGGWTDHTPRFGSAPTLFGTDYLSQSDSYIISCDTLNGFVRSLVDVGPNNKLFWKGFVIIRQPIGDGVVESKVPIRVDAVHTYELTVNKIRYQILRDPSGTIPRHLIGQDLEMLIAVNPLNKTVLGSTPFDGFQTMRAIRENIRTQYPAAADRATIRVIEANVGVGSSMTVNRIEPTETPLEPPGGVGG